MNTKTQSKRPIDLVHLSRQTLGDRTLEREILCLFVRQSSQLSQRLIKAHENQEQHDLAHTLIGSAKAIGAWQVAEAAEAVEASLDKGAVETSRTLRYLITTIEEANSLINSLIE